MVTAVDPGSGSGYDDLLIESVEGYLTLGWKLFVLRHSPSGEKTPAGNCRACDLAGPGHDMTACTCLLCHGFHAATGDVARLAQMFGELNGGQLAVRTGSASGIVVIDAEGHTDEEHMPTGVEVLDTWTDWAGGFPLTPTARALTPSGGVHMYYRTGSDATVRQRGRVLPNVDIKGEGGYVALPPGRGGDRRWLNVDGVGPSTFELSEPSAPLWSWLRTVRGGRGRSTSSNGSGDSAGHSGEYDYDAYLRDGPPRGVQSEFLNDRLFRLIAHQGVANATELFKIVWPEVETWEQRDDDPWQERDVRAKIDSMVRSIPAAEPIPTWRPRVRRRDGTEVGGSFEAESVATTVPSENVIAVDFGGDGVAGAAPPPFVPVPPTGGGDDDGDIPIRFDGFRGETTDDSGNAQRLVRLHGADIRFVADLQSWLIWNGVYWVRDRVNRVMDLTLSVTADIEDHALTIADDTERQRWGAFAAKSRSRAGRVAMLKNAESHPDLVLTPEALDRDKWSLVVRNGVLDLRTSTFTRPRREDLCTRAADVAYDPTATCPRWEEFVRFVTCDDAELATYLRRLAGYTLTGDTTAHAFFSLEGVGANGKNVFVETLMFMMGDYATVASTKLLTQGDKSHAAIVADLAGARLVFVDEIPQGKHVDVERMKSFTGSARIKAQHMRENWFFFEPQMKFWIAGNEQPRFKDSSDGIWRRMHRILFRAKVTEEQKIADYARILHEEEGAGILNWCLAGLRDFHERGKKLDAPESVKAAVIELRTDEDHFAAFVDECLEITGDATLTGDWITNAQLFQLYTGWCDANGVSKVDRHNGVHLSRTVAKMPGLERFNDRRSGKRERGFGGVRAATSALSIMGGALL